MSLRARFLASNQGHRELVNVRSLCRHARDPRGSACALLGLLAAGGIPTAADAVCASASEYLHVVASLDLDQNNRDIALMGSRLYLANEALGVAVVDVADPEHPSLISHLDLGSTVTQVETGNNHVYVTDAVGLRVLDVSPSGDLSLHGTFGASGTLVDLELDGTLALLVTREFGLRIIDVSNPGLPVQRSSVGLSNPGRITLHQQHAYIDTGVAFGVLSTLRVIDYTVPSAPISGASLPNFCLNGASDLGNDGSYLYALSDGGELPIVDIRQPNAPVRVAGVPYSDYIPPESIAIEDGVAYLTSYDISVLATWDLSTPGSPVVEGKLDLDNNMYSPFRVVTQRPFAYLMAGPLLQVIDVSSPRSAAILGSLNTNGSAERVAVAGNVAYVADGAAGLETVNAQDSTHPLALGGVDTPGVAWDVALLNSAAYVADGAAGLRVIDVTTPSVPILRGGYDTAGTARGVAVRGSLAFVADQSAGLAIIDVSNASAPTFVGSLDTPAQTLAVAVNASHAILAEDGPSPGTGTLRVVAIGNPAAPSAVGSLALPAPARDVELDGNLAYLALGDDAVNSGGLAIVDLSNPANPTLVEYFDLVTSTYGLSRSSEVVYLAGRHPIEATLGVQYTIDVRVPASPSLLLQLSLPVPARGLASNASGLYLADGSSGLLITAAECPLTTAVEPADRSRLEPLVAWPNPTSGRTRIAFRDARSTLGTIEIFDASGRQLRALRVESSDASAWWDGKDALARRLPSGVYYARSTTSEGAGLPILLLH